MPTKGDAQLRSFYLLVLGNLEKINICICISLENHVNFDVCCYDTQKFDNNCDLTQLKVLRSLFLFVASNQGK